MAFVAVARHSLSSAVFDQVRDRILGGELGPGDELPSERLLAQELGVNRGAVREGLKRLEQARLVQVRHGGATQVLDWQGEAGLEVLPQLLVDARGTLQVEVARGILGLRQALAPTVAAAAAERRDAAFADSLDACVARLRAAASAAERQELAFEYWRALVAGSGQIAYRLAFNSLEHTYRRIWGLLTQVMDVEFRDADTLAALNAALRRGDATQAAECARRYVNRGSLAMNQLLDRYDRAGGA